MVDQWARRGVKRPLSTDDDFPYPDLSKSNRNLSMNLSSPGSEASRSPQWPQIHLANKITLTKGKRGDRLGLGDQLLQLLHHLGQKRSGFQQKCLACACVHFCISSTHYHISG